jgi:hypothetical protein
LRHVVIAQRHCSPVHAREQALRFVEVHKHVAEGAQVLDVVDRRPPAISHLWANHSSGSPAAVVPPSAMPLRRNAALSLEWG